MFLNLVCLYHCILPWEKCLANSGHFIKFKEWTRLIHKIAHCIKGISKFTNLKIIYFWSHMGFCVNKSHLCKCHQLSNCLHQNPRDHGYDGEGFTISILWQEKYKSYIMKKKANYSKWIASERMFPYSEKKVWTVQWGKNHMLQEAFPSPKFPELEAVRPVRARARTDRI